MNLAIIGAGESSRIKAEGLNIPKHLVKLNGEYLIERIIRIARQNKIKRVFCVINEKEPELKNYLLTENFSIPVNLIIKTTESSMHSLFALAPFLGHHSFCLATVDSVFDEREFSNFINYSISQEDTDGVLAITNYINDEKPLCVAMDEESVIFRFSDSKDGYNWATGGLYVLSSRIFNEIEYALNTKITRLRNFLRLLVSRGYVVKGYAFSKMIDVDHITDIAMAEEFLSKLKK